MQTMEKPNKVLGKKRKALEADNIYDRVEGERSKHRRKTTSPLLLRTAVTALNRKIKYYSKFTKM